MRGEIESRVLFEHGKLRVVGRMLPDNDAKPDDQDFDSPEQREDLLSRYQAGDFMYVGMTVDVIYNQARIGWDALWGIEHGVVGLDSDGKVIDADAWEFTPAEYHTPKNVVMPSPLAGVAWEAIDAAKEWLSGMNNADANESISAAQAWADPNGVH